MYNKASQTHRLREFCNSGNNEPNDTLMNVKCISGLITRELSMSHLFPEEVPELKGASTTTAEA